MGTRVLVRFGIISLCLTASAAAAQESSTVFRSGVDLVGLNVVVTDAQGRFVGGLSRDDFTVLEDGVSQDISFFAAMPMPIDLAILLDTSASMTDKITTVQQAAIGFTSVIRPGDRVAIVDIKDNVRVVHPLDEDVASARQAIAATMPRGNTSLYNGLYMTLKELVRQRRSDGEVRRQAMVVLSDGDDTSSLVAFDDVMELAKHAGVAIYTITLRSPAGRNLLSRNADSQQSEFSMKALAEETGARPFFPSAIAELKGVYDMIADELASQYSVAYIPKNPARNGAYRRISVRVDRPETRARTRTGYVAAPPSAIGTR
jgi:Ca-activated chloride channel homolog